MARHMGYVYIYIYIWIVHDYTKWICVGYTMFIQVPMSYMAEPFFLLVNRGDSADSLANHGIDTAGFRPRLAKHISSDISGRNSCS